MREKPFPNLMLLSHFKRKFIHKLPYRDYSDNIIIYVTINKEPFIFTMQHIDLKNTLQMHIVAFNILLCNIYMVNYRSRGTILCNRLFMFNKNGFE